MTITTIRGTRSGRRNAAKYTLSASRGFLKRPLLLLWIDLAIERIMLSDIPIPYSLRTRCLNRGGMTNKKGGSVSQLEWCGEDLYRSGTAAARDDHVQRDIPSEHRRVSWRIFSPTSFRTHRDSTDSVAIFSEPCIHSGGDSGRSRLFFFVWVSSLTRARSSPHSVSPWSIKACISSSAFLRSSMHVAILEAHSSNVHFDVLTSGFEAFEY